MTTFQLNDFKAIALVKKILKYFKYDFKGFRESRDIY